MAGKDYNTELLDKGEKSVEMVEEHARLLLYLSRLVHWYLAMPATSAPVERLFSVAGQVVPAKRASLNAHTVPLFVFLHEALPVVRKMTVRQIIMETIVVYLKTK